MKNSNLRSLYLSILCRWRKKCTVFCKMPEGGKYKGLFISVEPEFCTSIEKVLWILFQCTEYHILNIMLSQKYFQWLLF